MDNNEIHMPVAKAASAIGLAGVTWSEWAAILAAFYTFLLIGEWLWKRLGRPFAEGRGWIKPRAAPTESEWARLRPGGE